MTMLPASLVLGGLINSNGIYKRWQLGSQNSIQIYGKGAMVWSKKDVILRKPPYTINMPTGNQAYVRVQFGEAARREKNARGVINGLPAVAAALHEMKEHGLLNLKSPNTNPELWESKKHHTLHTIEQLRKYIEEQKTATPFYGAASQPAFV